MQRLFAERIHSSLLVLAVSIGMLPVSIHAREATHAARRAAANQAPGKPYQRGMASWYGKQFDGKKTASGQRFHKDELTAAHRTLPIGTKVRVVNPQTRKSVVVTITDRGPKKRHVIIDLSRAAAARLGRLKKGMFPVELYVVAEAPETARDAPPLRLSGEKSDEHN